MTQWPRTFHGLLVYKYEHAAATSVPKMSVAGKDDCSPSYITTQIQMAPAPHKIDSRMSSLSWFLLYQVFPCYLGYANICPWIHHHRLSLKLSPPISLAAQRSHVKAKHSCCCYCCYHHFCLKWSPVNGSRNGAMWLYLLALILQRRKEKSLLEMLNEVSAGESPTAKLPEFQSCLCTW